MFCFSHEKITGLFILEKVKPSPDYEMIKLLTFVISSIRRVSLKPITEHDDDGFHVFSP